MASPPQDDPAIVDSTAALASLYQAPFAEFVARRSALVSQLKRSGHKDVASRIASAAKPTRAAFLVNQVYWRARATYDAVLDTGTAARAAQQARLLGDESDLADTLDARDAAVADAVHRAERIAADEGQPSSDAIRAQVRASFEALAAHGREARLPHGQLTADVELPGLAALAGLVLPESAPPPVRRFEVVARRPASATDPPATPPEPDPRIAELEGRLAEARLRERESAERAVELDRALEASRDVLTTAEAAAEEASRKVRTAQEAVDRGERAHAAAAADAARRVQEREAVERELAALQEHPPTEPDPARDSAPGVSPRPAPKGGKKTTSRRSGPARAPRPPRS